MEAFRARRLVWSAMSEITLTMPAICVDLPEIDWMACTASVTASMPVRARLMDSWEELETSSRVRETCCTELWIWFMLLELCSTEAAWLWACSLTCSTLAASSSTAAEVSSRVEAWSWASAASF